MISVCIASHNGGKYIQEQLTSILDQLSSEDEVIISDDGSVDDTVNKIKAFDDKRIKLLSFQQSEDFSERRLSSYYYATANFQNALLQAQGEYIFLSDQDDVWYENKVALTLNALQTHDLVVSNFSIIDEYGKLENRSFYSINPYANLSFFSVLKKLPFRGCCLAFRKEVLTDSLPFPKGLFLHDCWIGLMAYWKRRKLYYIDEPLIKYRRHLNNVSDLESRNSFVFKIKYRLTLLWLLSRH